MLRFFAYLTITKRSLQRWPRTQTNKPTALKIALSKLDLFVLRSCTFSDTMPRVIAITEQLAEFLEYFREEYFATLANTFKTLSIKCGKTGKDFNLNLPDVLLIDVSRCICMTKKS